MAPLSRPSHLACVGAVTRGRVHTALAALAALALPRASVRASQHLPHSRSRLDRAVTDPLRAPVQGRAAAEQSRRDSRRRAVGERAVGERAVGERAVGE
jgi:hypothetical protein